MTPKSYGWELNEYSCFIIISRCFCFIDPCYVDVSLVLKYAQDVNEQEIVDFVSSMLDTTAERSDRKIVKQVKNRADSLKDGYVELCSPVQIYVLPKSSSH